MVTLPLSGSPQALERAVTAVSTCLYMILRTLQNEIPEFVTTPWFTGQSGAAQLAFGGFTKLGIGFVGLNCKALSTPALPVCVGDPLTS